jgi:FkbM family methyltransferase
MQLFSSLPTLVNALDNVFVHNSGVGSVPGSITVPSIDYARPGNFGGVSLSASGAGETVPLATIDSLGLQRCDFMKIDVEGMELDVLQGAKSTVERFRPRLYIENDHMENRRHSSSICSRWITSVLAHTFSLCPG